MQDPLLLSSEEHSECLLGNEAIVRGALEAGVAFASGYPGTPSSEITDSFARLAPARGIVFEYSVNEKVALEMAFAASLAGARSICAMKHLGLLVAGDPLSTIPYIGVEAGMVIVSAGDPGCGTSPNEHDQRLLGPMLHIPILDPSTSQDAHDMARFAFDLSEDCRLPVLIRATTHVCHTRSAVAYGPLREPEVAGFVRNPSRYNPIPVNARRMREELTDRIERAREMMSSAGFFRVQGTGSTVVLAAGAPAATCADVLAEHPRGDSVGLWTLGVIYPLPEAQLIEQLREVERVLVVEELAPYLEDAVQLLCARNGLTVEVLGKHTGHFPEAFEYRPEVIASALGRLFDGAPPRDAPVVAVSPPAPNVTSLDPVPPRPPTLCPGCPHRAAFLAARAAFDDDQLFFNDIGCYTLGYGAPLETSDALVCMGAGFTLAAGVSRVTGKRTVGFLGDSTFFHAGMPPLLNAVKEDANMVAVILDNQVTAMTGFQESAGRTPQHPVSIERVVAALGVKHIEKVDPFDHAATVAAFRRARDGSGVSAVIVERACPVHEIRQVPGAEAAPLFAVDPSRCRRCGRADEGLRCAQPITVPYERQLSRGRMMRSGPCAPVLAPCATQCPLSLCIEGYVGHIAGGEYVEALGHILDRTPLPETVCRVCHSPCESVCVRNGTDEPVAINKLKRFVVEWAAAQEQDPYVPDVEPDHGRRVAVVGAGPAGLAAAHDLRLRGYEVALLDAADRPGGLLAYGIPAYRLPPIALARDIERILALGVTFQGGVRLGRDLTLEGLVADGYDAVCVAVGAGRARTLPLESGEGKGSGPAPGSPRVTTALDYLGALASEGSVETGERVVVVGGGNAAVDAARAARRLGGRHVTMVFPEAREEMPAIVEEVVAAEREGIRVVPSTETLRTEVNGIVCRTGGAAGEEIRLEASQVIVAIGQEVDRDFAVAGEISLEHTADGHIGTDPETGSTSHPRIFAAGDAAGAERMVTSAIASGQRAAWGIDRSLRGTQAADRRLPPRPVVTDPEPASPPQSLFREGRCKPPRLDPAQRTDDFAEVLGGLTEEQARAEAARCLMCGMCGNCSLCIDLFACPALLEGDGHVRIDSALCTGCGVCALICPNDAIREVDRA